MTFRGPKLPHSSSPLEVGVCAFRWDFLYPGYVALYDFAN